ncbi:hypothetical protein B7Z28_00765 [Candidatus Saccharibacteria bacterium 32-45-3]|nr:MAG: hypothetical protein B7Z28_00765 [Candidatus Saccharibacteria bacterium 32-45-3]
MQLVSNYCKPILSREERHYRNQFKAVKELILATMDCKDIATLEPEGLYGAAGTGFNEETSVAEEKKNSEKEAMNDSAAAADDAAVKPVLHTINLRHRNRDLYYNMQKVKDVEKIALNYADFCVNNAVNVIDSAAYDKFQATLFASELDRFHSKAASLHSVEVQTDIPTIHHPYPSSGFTTHNPSVNSSPDVNIRKSSVFGTSDKLTTGRKRGDSILLRSQSERVRTPNTNDAAAHKVVRESTSRNSDTVDTLGFSRPTSAFNTDSVNPDTTKPKPTNDFPNEITAEGSVKSSNIDRPMSASEKEYTRVRTPVDTSPKNMLVALKQLREEAALEAEVS